MVTRACDRCYWNKEKCSFILGNEACTRCRYLNLACCMSRKQRRMGRRPSSKTLYGSLHIWEYERDDNTAKTNNHRRGPCSTTVSRRDRPLIREKKEDSKQTTNVALDEILRSRSRLQTTTDAMRIVTHDVQFAVIHIPFAMGRSFIHDLRTSIYSILSQSGSTVTDGYIAFMALVAHCQAARLCWSTPDLCRGAKALQCLRNIKPAKPQDAIGILLLGQILFVFEILTDKFTSSAHSIVQSALISARQWYPLLLQEPKFDTMTICPIFMDTVCCLAYRKVPIIRFPIQHRMIVDRYIGVSSTLLPLLYDLCEISYVAKSTMTGTISPNSTATTDEDHAEDCYSAIEKSIESWTPILPPDLLSAYDKTEVQMMLTQANVYRLAGLLVIHRLRYRLGVRDSIAQHYAMCILSEISSSCAGLAQDGGAGGFPIMFPVLISMFEVEGLGEELLEKMSGFMISSVCMSKLRGFVNHVRMAKESGFNGLWFDLVEEHLHYAVIP